MRRLFLLLALFVGLSLRAAAITVFYAEKSVPEGERRYAKTLATHLQRWYREAGIEVDLRPDAELGTIKDLRLAFLVDCYAPPKEVITAVKKRRDAGVRFVVCYSASAELAELFGLKVGKYVRNDQGAWSKMGFAKGAVHGAPEEIAQTSTNLFTVTAAGHGAVPIAWWYNRQNKRTEVAWWRTRGNSFWMTHILSGDGDERGKQRLLLALAAESVPGVWKKAANHLYRTSVRPAQTLLNKDIVMPSFYHKKADLQERQRQLAMTRQLIAAQEVEVKKRLEADSAESYQAVCDLSDLVTRAVGMRHWSRPGEICGVWDHSGQGLYPGDWERTAKRLAAAGVTDLYVNIAGAAFALYPSKVLPQRGSEDCLLAAQKACRKYGIRVHAWILCFSMERAVGQSMQKMAAQRGWLLQDIAGKELNWLDPTHPEVRQHLLNVVREIATRYQPDGIHLDFIRYPGLQQTMGPRIRARFEAQHGRVGDWAQIGDANHPAREAFLKWRAGKIADSVQSVRTWMRANVPQMQLSAAVYGKYPSCVGSVGQDWLSWLRMGLIDYALPMNYTEDMGKLRDWLGTQTANKRLAPRIISGIGVTAAESRLGALEVLNQIEAARRANCRGFVLFDLDETLNTAILPVLSAGVTAP